MSVVFYSSSKHLVEFDWMLPLMIGYSNKDNVVLICSNSYSFENTFFKKYSFAEKYNFKIIHKNDIYLLAKYFYIITKNKKVLNLFSRFENKFSHYGILKHICEKADLIFASNFPISIKHNLENLFYSYAKHSKGLFIGTPIVPWVHWYQPYFYDFDYFLCSSSLEFQTLKELTSSTKIIYLGCPSFDSNYLELFNDLGPIKPCIKKQKSILFIMVNTFNPIYEGFDIYGDLFNCIKSLELKGFSIIIKLHPTSQKFDITKLTKMGISIEYFTFESIEKLNSKIDIAVTYLSTSILKCIACNITSYVYLPASLLESFPKSENNIFFDLYFKENSCRFEDVCAVINDINQINFINTNLNSELKFSSIFCRDNSTDNIISYFQTEKEKILKYE